MNTKHHCFPELVILQAVYMKLRFTLSYRDVEEFIISVHSQILKLDNVNISIISLNKTIASSNGELSMD